MFEAIQIEYENRLKQKGELDFDDLVLDATSLIKAGQYNSPYRLIIVDEFQDISQSRARLVHALLEQQPRVTLFCVGDDWQAIYRFAGADISIFTKFEAFFGYTRKQYLTQTFRSNQGIADVASQFVQKNPSQLTKQVKALDSNHQKVVELHYYQSNQQKNECLAKILTEINQQAGPQPTSVFILGRYNHLYPEFLDQLKPLLSGCRIEFKTIHASKGLQADIVILLGLHKGASAFPSEMEDDPLINLVLPEPERYARAEERRLFYVALTRAKHKVYLLGDEQSVFLTELFQDPKLKPILNIPDIKQPVTVDVREIPTEWLCPNCKQGRVRKKNGKYGPFLGCDRYPACRYTKNLKVKS